MSFSNLTYDASPQYVVISEKACDRNVLDINIQNSKSETLNFYNSKCLPPEKYPEFDEIKNNKDLSGFYIYFDYGPSESDMAEYSDAENICMSSLTSNWNVSKALHDDTIGYYWIAAPAGNISLNAKESISFRISELKCNAVVGESKIHIVFMNGNSSITKDLDIYKLNKLNMGDDIYIDVPQRNLTVDVVSSIYLYIANKSLSSLTFSNPDGLTPDQYPEYDDFLSGKDLPRFYMRFSYGNSAGNITSSDGENINVSVMDNSHWKVTKGRSESKGYYWIICPDGTRELGPDDFIKIHIENIDVNKIAGLTPLYLELRSGGEINAKVMGLFKYDKPEIASFKIEGPSYDIGDTVTFKWEIKNGDQCSVSINNTDVSITQGIIKVEDIDYELAVKNPAGFFVTKAFTPTFEYFLSFSAKSCDGEEVEVEWKTKNTDYCKIDAYSELLSSEGTCKLPAKRGAKDIFKFTLTAYSKGSRKPHNKTLEFGYPQITKFNSKQGYCSPPPELNIDFKDDADNPFISLDEIKRFPIVPAVAVPYDGYSPVEWKNGIEWNGNFVLRYELHYVSHAGTEECETFDRGGYFWVASPDGYMRQYTLRAYGLSDTYDEQSKYI